MSTLPTPSRPPYLRTALVIVLAVAVVLFLWTGADTAVRSLEAQAATAQARETCGMAHEDFLKMPQATQDELRVRCAPAPSVFGQYGSK
jgi:hypothetical protein